MNVRGQNRKWKEIEQWVETSLQLDLENIREQGRDFVKIWIPPWGGKHNRNGTVPEPERATKRKLLTGLLDIYDSWNKQLQTLDEPYYLKLLLFEPRFSQSQVICGTGKFLDFYDNAFHRPQEQRQPNLPQYGELSKRLEEFNWEYFFDEEYFDNLDLERMRSEKGKVKKLMRRPHRKRDEADTDQPEFYAFKQGNLWLGSK